jgi:hypothetical protein
MVIGRTHDLAGSAGVADVGIANIPYKALESD